MARAPRPAKRPQTRTHFGDTRVDEYGWLRERDEPEVAAHLAAENAYTEQWLAERTGPLREQLFAEMRARIDERDHSVPIREGEWLYWARTEQGDEYSRHVRVRIPRGQPEDFDPRELVPGEQIFLDENALAEGHDFYDLTAFAISPDQRRCAWLDDVEGDEVFSLRVLDLDGGERLAEVIEGCGSSLAWADDHTIFYTRLDEAQRPHEAWRHRVGSDPSEDVLVLAEPDPRFYVSLWRTRSHRFVALSLDSRVTSEMWLIPSDQPDAAPRCVAAREQDVEYAIEHVGERVFMLTNHAARNFRVLVASLDRLDDWQEFLAHREDVAIEDIDAFEQHLVVWERKAGLQQIRVIALDSANPDSRDEHCVEFPDPTYAIWSSSNPDVATTTLRFGYSSLTTPSTIYDYDLRTRERTLRKRQEVLGGHDPAEFGSLRIWASAPDGQRVPISLVWHGSARPTEARPLLLDGYGAYGAINDPVFASSRLSLLRRGMVWAIAHVRGGAELGRAWYDQGKLAHKHHTFSDFIACAEHLIGEGWTAVDRLACMGGSAGGLLVGAVLNARPELFRVAIADVPFVDALESMLDETLPLSLIEREEWGDPTTPEGYGWLRSYSPYDNVRSQGYPDVLAIAGLNDTRVGYWEAAKWIARLRDHDTRGAELLLWVAMNVGHAGASGRFEYLRELAIEHAFLIERLGLPRALA
ncbi:S9 family peptidase [Nannocystaceae bacterium ST9]